jgi:predicted Zn finger-like uncharacterized protein
MKIRCPKCNTLYNIDESKIPEKGAYVRCKKCQNKFHIEKDEQKEEFVERDETAWEPCPRCGSRRVKKSWGPIVAIYVTPCLLLFLYDMSNTVYLLGFEVYSPVTWLYYVILGFVSYFVYLLWQRIHGVNLKCKDCNYIWAKKKKEVPQKAKPTPPIPRPKETLIKDEEQVRMKKIQKWAKSIWNILGYIAISLGGLYLFASFTHETIYEAVLSCILGIILIITGIIFIRKYKNSKKEVEKLKIELNARSQLI